MLLLAEKAVTPLLSVAAIATLEASSYSLAARVQLCKTDAREPATAAAASEEEEEEAEEEASSEEEEEEEEERAEPEPSLRERWRYPSAMAAPAWPLRPPEGSPDPSLGLVAAWGEAEDDASRAPVSSFPSLLPGGETGEDEETGEEEEEEEAAAAAVTAK